MADKISRTLMGSIPNPLMKRMLQLKQAASTKIDLSFVEETPGGIGDPIVLPLLAEAYLETGILPWDRRLKYRFYRFFARYDPFVGRAVELHSEIPLSKVRVTKANSVQRGLSGTINYRYGKLVKDLNLFKKLNSISMEYNVIGDAFMWHVWNDDGLTLKEIIILPPERVEVVLDEEQNRRIFLITADDKTKEELNQDPLKGDYVFQLSRYRFDYAPYGVSLLERNLKRLFYRERLFQLESRNISKALNAIDLITTSTEVNIEQLDTLADQIMAAVLDPENKVIVNYEVNWHVKGAMEGLAELDPKWDRTRGELISGLGITEGLMSGDAVFSGEKLALEVIGRNYLNYREVLQDYVENSIFYPVAVRNNFFDWADRDTGQPIYNLGPYLIKDPAPGADPEYSDLLKNYMIHKDINTRRYNPFTDWKIIQEFIMDPRKADRVYIHPKLKFDRLPFKDNDAMYNAFMNLYNKGSIPLEAVLDLLDIDPVDAYEKTVQDLYTVKDPNMNDAVRAAYQNVGAKLAENQSLQDVITKNLGLTPNPTPPPPPPAGAGLGGLPGLGSEMMPGSPGGGLPPLG